MSSASDHLTHVVQVRVSYREIEGPWTPEESSPREGFEMIVTPPSTGVDLDALRMGVEQIAGGPDFILDQRVHHHSWGADATIVEFILQSTAAGVIGGAAWDAAKSLGKAISRGRTEEERESEPIGEREAKGWARQLAVRRLDDLTDDQLTDAVSVDLRDDGATVEFGCIEGGSVIVSLELVDGLIALGSAKRVY